ncbi:MAG: monovalent cation:proton antiporter-2 (CPA2) family protein [Parvibaculaceae bacterium]|nr:monovalent cation:proton antiporter-2 (CPA2) family protein [Parvibaculaceae bacterium]
MSMMITLAVLLLGMVLVVPFTKRLGLGSVLGYLLVGAIVGPQCLGLVQDSKGVKEASELGVIMLLFLIGLEIKPARLWTMRKTVLGLGGSQIIVTGAAIGAALYYIAGFGSQEAIIVGLGLALSSTALVLPLLSDLELIKTPAGRTSFAVLLMQDVAVIPLLAVLPLLVDGPHDPPADVERTQVYIAIAMIIAVLTGGRFLVRMLLQAVDKARASEIATATALLIVLGMASLASIAGVSTSLGAFLAGVILSDSEYKHELEADIAPFESLLLGMFFVSVGMSANLSLLSGEPGSILLAVFALVAIKAVVGIGLIKLTGRRWDSSIRTGVALSQGAEFGFVLFAAALKEGLFDDAMFSKLLLIIALSMVTTPPLMLLVEALLKRFSPKTAAREYDAMEDSGAPVLIIGFGRIGQIVGRVLRVRRIAFTALETDISQLDFVRRFGIDVYYGDASRPDLLRAAGANSAKAALVCIEDEEQSIQVIETIRKHFPHLNVLASANTRQHAHRLMASGVTNVVRSTLHSSLLMAERLMEALQMPHAEARRTIELFRVHDERALNEQAAFWDDAQKVLQNARQTAQELEELFESDAKSDLVSTQAAQ